MVITWIRTRLSKALGSPVFAISAKTLLGISEFRQAVLELAELEQPPIPTIDHGDEQALRTLSRSLSRQFGINASIVLKNQNRIDAFMLNSISGGLAFLVVMFLLFQSIFTLAAPLMDGVESGIADFAHWVTSYIGEGRTSDFLNDAIFGGIGSFLVFVPQIMMLTLIIGLLEDSGYLARAALICHRPLSYFGLSGRSFIPYLSGHACAIPAIMAARTIESPRKRFTHHDDHPTHGLLSTLTGLCTADFSVDPRTKLFRWLSQFAGYCLLWLVFNGDSDCAVSELHVVDLRGQR